MPQSTARHDTSWHIFLDVSAVWTLSVESCSGHRGGSLLGRGSATFSEQRHILLVCARHGVASGPQLVPAQAPIGREAADEDVSPDHEAHGTVLVEVRPILMLSVRLDQHARWGGYWGGGGGCRKQEVRAVDRERLAQLANGQEDNAELAMCHALDHRRAPKHQVNGGRAALVGVEHDRFEGGEIGGALRGSGCGGLVGECPV
eukprot:scaffold128246_cov63-Phaeocystis_antarctica.AAC.3